MTGPSTLWILKNLSDECVKWGPFWEGDEIAIVLSSAATSKVGGLWLTEKKKRACARNDPLNFLRRCFVMGYLLSSLCWT